MKKNCIIIFLLVFFIFACIGKIEPQKKNDISDFSNAEKSQKKVYTEIWGLDITRSHDISKVYNGFWRMNEVESFTNSNKKNKNYSQFELIYNISSNYYFVCNIFNGFSKSGGKHYYYKVRFTVLEEANSVEGFEKYGCGLIAFSNSVPKNYMGSYTIFKTYNSRYEMVDFAIDNYSGEYVTGYTPYIKSYKILPELNPAQTSFEIFIKQDPDETLDTLIRVDPLEGLWYIPTAQEEASEADFVNTKAILIIGKDERHNPGWYHVVIYYDSGDPERGWVCEWGAAEIAEKEIEVQLSHISEGKPYTITLKEENGRRWIETTNQAATVKGQQFIRILPLK